MIKQVDVFKVFPEGKKFARIILVEDTLTDEELRVISITSAQAENAMDIADLTAAISGTNKEYILDKVEEILNRPESPIVPRKKSLRREGGTKHTAVEITISIKF